MTPIEWITVEQFKERYPDAVTVVNTSRGADIAIERVIECACTGRDKPLGEQTTGDALAACDCPIHGISAIKLKDFKYEWPIGINTYPPHRGHAGGH